jgi:hypothetical protein
MSSNSAKEQLLQSSLKVYSAFFAILRLLFDRIDQLEKEVAVLKHNLKQPTEN